MAGTLSDLGTTMFSRTFSRDEEREADEKGISYAAGAGFSVDGGIRAWERMSKNNTNLSIPFLSTHPAPDERIETMRKLALNYPQRADQVLAAREPAPVPAANRGFPVTPAPVEAPVTSAIAAIAPSQSPYTAQKIDAKLVEEFFSCLAKGLPPGWKRTWVEITDQGGGKEKNSKFRVSNIRDSDDEGEPLVPCNAQELTGRIVGLNDKLPPDRRAWRRALLVIDSDGQYELTYEYAK